LPNRKDSYEAPARFPQGALAKMREMRAEGSSYREIAEHFGTDEATVWRHANDVIVMKKAALNSSEPPSYGGTSISPIEATHTMTIFAGTLQVSRVYPGIIDFVVPRNIPEPTVNLAASGSTFEVQLLTHNQMKRFVPSEPPQKPGDYSARWAPHPRFWQSPLVRSIVKELRLPFSDDWYFVFQNPPESKEENSIQVEAKLTITKVDPPPTHS